MAKKCIYIFKRTVIYKYMNRPLLLGPIPPHPHTTPLTSPIKLQMSLHVERNVQWVCVCVCVCSLMLVQIVRQLNNNRNLFPTPHMQNWGQLKKKQTPITTRKSTRMRFLCTFLAGMNGLDALWSKHIYEEKSQTECWLWHNRFMGDAADQYMLWSKTLNHGFL